MSGRSQPCGPGPGIISQGSPDRPRQRVGQGHFSWLGLLADAGDSEEPEISPPAALGEVPSRSWRTRVRFPPPPPFSRHAAI